MRRWICSKRSEPNWSRPPGPRNFVVCSPHGSRPVSIWQVSTASEKRSEQRVVTRAKGLLMAAQGMIEDDSFAYLRSRAMQTRLPLAGMARAVVDAAIWSETVNRAGQLRWLSQRCIAAAAQRLAHIDPPPPAEFRTRRRGGRGTSSTASAGCSCRLTMPCLCDCSRR